MSSSIRERPWEELKCSAPGVSLGSEFMQGVWFLSKTRMPSRSALGARAALTKCSALHGLSAISKKTSEVRIVKGATRNTCPSSPFHSHSLATGPAIREANHILIYSALIDFFFFKTPISVSNKAFHRSAHR